MTSGNVPPWLLEGGVNPVRIMRHIAVTEGGAALYRGLGERKFGVEVGRIRMGLD